MEHAAYTLISGLPDAPLLCAHAGREEFAWYEGVSRRFGVSVFLCSGFDWDGDLSPWPAILPGRTERAFRGEAARHLEMFCASLEACERSRGLRPKERWIMGYSLAGLFSVYAGLVTDRFDAIASVSGSLWYPGFADWVSLYTGPARRLYCSLGDRESRTRHPVFRAGGDNALRVCKALERQGWLTRFEWTSGGHFQSAEERLTRAIIFLTATERA